jgi:hypothetical protein
MAGRYRESFRVELMFRTRSRGLSSLTQTRYELLRQELPAARRRDFHSARTMYEELRDPGALHTHDTAKSARYPD